MSGSGTEMSATGDERGRPRWIPRAAFWIVLLAVFALSAWPHPPNPPFAPSDKVQHALAFLCLGLLGAGAYPRLSPIRLGLGLAAFGALIEAVQAIPALHRQTELLDWLADIAATVLALAIVSAWRRWGRKA